MSKLKKIGADCFGYNPKLKKLYIPELEEIGSWTFGNIKHLKELIAPKLKEMGRGCFEYGTVLRKLYAPELTEIYSRDFNDIKIIQNLYAPKLQITEDTPKCIRRAIKVAKFKDGIRNILGLPRRNFDNGNFSSSQRAV